MSCLSRAFRLKTTSEFNKVYKSNKKWHTHSFVAFFRSSQELKFGFVASKKVGNAVKRNRAKRLLQALVLEYENKLQAGEYIFVAKEDIFGKDFRTLKKDFTYAMKKMELF